MSTPVAGSLSVTPLYTAPGDILVSWDDVNATWRSLPGVSAPMTVGQGGTGATTLAANAMLVGNGTGPIVASAITSDNGATLRVSTNQVIGNAVTSPPSHALVINNAASTPQAIATAPQLWLSNEGTGAGMLLDSYGTGAPPAVVARRARGTAAAPTAIQQQDTLFALNMSGCGATGYGAVTAQIIAFANQNWSDTAQGTKIALATTSNNATALSTRMLIGQGVQIGNPGPDMGVGGLALTRNITAPTPNSGNAMLQIDGSDGLPVLCFVNAYGASPTLYLRRFDGTLASPSPVLNNEALGLLTAQARGATANFNGGYISFDAIENWSDTQQGAAITLVTTGLGTTGTVTRARVRSGLVIHTTTGVAPGGGTAGDMGPGTVNVPTAGGFYVNGADATRGHLRGTATNDSAAAGEVGEVISSVVAAGVACAPNSTVTVATISLTAGDWDVAGEVWCGPSGTGVTAFTGGISLSATMPVAPSLTTAMVNAQITAAVFDQLALAPCRQSLSATTTIFLLASAGGGTGNSTMLGKIFARRTR